MPRAAIDTGALLALASPRDQYHAQAVQIGRRFAAEGGSWVGSALVLAEFHGHLLKWRGPALARRILAALLRDPVYEWRDATLELIDGAMSGWLERFDDQRFSLTDAVTFELMRQEGIGVAFAFDEDFRTAGFELLS